MKKVTDIRPGMIYLGLLIVVVEFFGNVAKLYLEDKTVLTFAKDSYLLIDEVIDASNSC